jgi:hypothetical protein
MICFQSNAREILKIDSGSASRAYLIEVEIEPMLVDMLAWIEQHRSAIGLRELNSVIEYRARNLGLHHK